MFPPKVFVVELHTPNRCSHFQKERRIILFVFDQLSRTVTDDSETIVFVDLGQNGAQTPFQFVGTGGGVDDQGVSPVTPRVVDDRVRHQGGLEFLIGQVGLLR